MLFIGEIAGFSVACFRAISGIQFSDAGTRIGSFYVNKVRLAVATLLFIITIPLVTGVGLFAQTNSSQVLWLCASSMIGLVFGDACGFKALVMIGPRLSTLIRTSTPIITTTIAWFFLDEKLHTYEAAGIAITVFGIAWVVAERKDNNTLHKSHRDSGSLTTGVLLSLGSSLGQAAGLVLAKHAMTQCGGAIDPYAAAFVRIVMATAVIWIYSIVKGEALSAVQTIRDDPKSFRLIVGGAVSSTFLGIWMSLVAVKYVDAGVAETLGSMTPIVILPLLWKLKGEHISLRAIIGSFVAVGGVAVMFLLP